MATTASAAQGSGNDGTAIFSTAGLVALVTGGGTGVGFMMAKALAKAGASRVYIAGRRKEVLQSAVESIGLPSVVPLTCDVTSKESLAAAVEAVERDVGFLNLLVCNSGVGGPPSNPIIKADTTLEAWRDGQLAVDAADYDRTFQVNCRAVWFTAMSFLTLLDAGNRKGNVSQSSQIVVTSSVAAFNKKAPGGWAYGQSKAAVSHLVKHLSTALPQWNIRTNCIAPGLFPSEMSAPIVEAMTKSSADGNWDESKPIPVGRDSVPLGRMGNSDEMGGSILYLASRAGAYCNGNIMLVDGGRLTTFPATGY